MATVTCPSCQQRDARIQDLERRLRELGAQLRDLQARLGQNATNSSLPPSAPKPVTKAPTGRKPGGQSGHTAHLRRHLPPARVTRTVPFLPTHCERCHGPLPPDPGPGDPEPSWHQVAELPEIAAQVTEYQGHYRT